MKPNYDQRRNHEAEDSDNDDVFDRTITPQCSNHLDNSNCSHGAEADHEPMPLRGIPPGMTARLPRLPKLAPWCHTGFS